MKRKDLINLAFALALLVATGLILWRFVLGANRKPQPVTIEVVPEISSTYDAAAINEITAARNFTAQIDLSGLGNPRPFGQ